VLYGNAGITKLDLARYFVDVGGAFVTAKGDRPVSLQRFPAGIDGEQYFSKNPPRGAPDYVRAVTVTYPSGRQHPQMVVDEPAGAVWAVQMNTIVFHPWASRAAAPDYPDELRIDLDPQPGTDFDDAIVVELRAVLVEAGLTAFVKTSGNRGPHVFAPIEPRHEFLEVRHAVIAASRELERRMPAQVTTAWWAIRGLPCMTFPARLTRCWLGGTGTWPLASVNYRSLPTFPKCPASRRACSPAGPARASEFSRSESLGPQSLASVGVGVGCRRGCRSAEDGAPQ